MFTLSQSNSVQNSRSFTLKTKELWRGVENSPHAGATPAKKPSANRVKQFVARNASFHRLQQDLLIPQFASKTFHSTIC